MSTHGEFVYKNLSRDQFDLVIEWAAREGWNPGCHDAGIFWDTDPQAHLGVFLKDKLLGSGSIFSYQGHFGFMGLFIMEPEFRHQGIGRSLWYFRRDKLLTRLHAGAAIGMDGVFTMQPFYAKGGFTFTHRNLRMEGTSRAFTPDSKLVELSQIPWEKVLAFDATHFGAARPKFLRPWIQQPGALALGYVENDELLGIGVIRPCLKGSKIGPLFARSEQIARVIFEGLSSHSSPGPVFLDIPENNPAAVRLARDYDLREVFGCARMYYGGIPPTPWQFIYGITTFEAG